METDYKIKEIDLKSKESVNSYTIEGNEDLSLFRIKGRNPDKSILISTYLHGDEPCGYLAVKKILSQIQLPNITIYILLGNVGAAKVGKRFIKENYNRIWNKKPNTQIEEKAQRIIKKLKTKNVLGVLDLHSFSDKESEPHLFHLNSDFAKKFFHNKIKFVFKVEAKENMLIECFESIPSFLVECGYHKNPNSVKFAYYSIKNFLKKFKVISNSDSPITMDTTLYLEMETNIKFKKKVKLNPKLHEYNLRKINKDIFLGFCNSQNDIFINGKRTFEDLFYIEKETKRLFLKKNHFVTLMTSNSEKMFESGCYIYKI